MTDVQRLAKILSGARSGIACTGAGISTESGIPDFRSPGGVWSRNQPVMYDDFLRSRDERVRYWAMRAEMYRDFVDAKPNDGHAALVTLEKRGHLTAVITQNIDGLHQDAGSRRVIELHGTNRIIACQRCGKQWLPPEILARLDAGDDAPDCDACKGPLKSKTISFGQAMPEREMRESTNLALESDVCLAIGSSLVVEPAASVPRMAKESGATLVIINLTPTPLDSVADLIIREPIGVTLIAALEHLDALTETKDGR